jgi:hypothetical protein
MPPEGPALAPVARKVDILRSKRSTFGVRNRPVAEVARLQGRKMCVQSRSSSGILRPRSLHPNSGEFGYPSRLRACSATCGEPGRLDSGDARRAFAAVPVDRCTEETRQRDRTLPSRRTAP